MLSTVILILTRVLGFLQSTEIDKRPDKNFRQDFTGASAAEGGSKNKEHIPLLAINNSLRRGRRACILCGVRVHVGPGDGPEGWLRCFAHHLSGIV